MTPSDLSRMEALAEKATNGPWEICGGRDDAVVIAVGRTYDSVEQVRYDGSPVADCETRATCGVHESEEEANAKFIAASRTFVPQAIAEIRRLRALVERAYLEGASQAQ